MRLLFFIFLSIGCQLAYSNCSVFFSKLADKNLSIYLDQAILEKDSAKIQKSLKVLPEQTVRKLLSFSQDTTWPFTNRLFALRQAYRNASLEPNLPEWVKKDLQENAEMHVENFLEVTKTWASGALPEDFGLETSLTGANIPEQFRRFNIKHNNDLSILNNDALGYLAKVKPELYLKKIRVLKELAVKVGENTEEVHHKVFRELEKTFSNLTLHKMDFKLLGKTFEILAESPATLNSAIELSKYAAMDFGRTPKDKDTQELWDKNIALMNRNLGPYLSKMLDSAEGRPRTFYAIMSETHDIAYIRACKSEPSGSHDIADRIQKTLNAASNKLSRVDIVNLHTESHELYLRTHDKPKYNELEVTEGIKAVLLRAAKESEADHFDAYQKQMGDPFEMYSSFALLNEFLTTIISSRPLRLQVKKIPEVQKLIEKIATQKDSQQIYGDKNVEAARAILTKQK